jgi:hypothetical protein
MTCKLNETDAWSGGLALGGFLWYNLPALMPAMHQVHALAVKGTE